MKLSIVIVNYNVKYFLEQCLDSVLKAIRSIDSEVFVVDNCSSDYSLEYLIPLFPEVKFIENKENVGFSRANNQAIRESVGEYVLLLNPDTLIGENSLLRICDFMDAHPDAGALGVKMIDGSGAFLPESKRGFPSPWNSFSKMSGLARLFPKNKLFGGYHLRYLDENQINEVDVLSGAFMLLRKTALDKAGLLDETFFMYGEDIDLSYRIHQAGFVNYYLPETILHYKGESTKKDIRYVRNFYEAMLIFFNKHYPDSNGLFKFMIRGAVVTYGFFSAVSKLLQCSGEKPKNQRKEEIVFNTSETSYEEMLRQMDKNPKKNILYRISHPNRGITIAANEVVAENRQYPT
ncbi:glycosyltransferase family 2 protein [Bacteroidales bacterium OttesenSCG-928-A17]|nr:glycosyltransferase family 2 protein [Bacteroidales bacterium OttesenSCG-928-A17]